MFIPGPGSLRLAGSFHLLPFLLRQRVIRDRRDVARKESCISLRLVKGPGLHGGLGAA